MYQRAHKLLKAVQNADLFCIFTTKNLFENVDVKGELFVSPLIAVFLAFCVKYELYQLQPWDKFLVSCYPYLSI